MYYVRTGGQRGCCGEDSQVTNYTSYTTQNKICTVQLRNDVVVLLSYSGTYNDSQPSVVPVRMVVHTTQCDVGSSLMAKH